jgi:hypothetical protein
MALVSPGVEIQVYNESAYASTAVGTVPLIVIATEQDKSNISNTGIAAGTTKTNAGKLAIVGSQRELATLYGAPYFERTSSNTPVHGGERNEYGLMAAYSLLGVSNRVLTVRANIDLKQLKATAVRPVGKPTDGIYWLDTAATRWGIFSWNAAKQIFESVTPKVITESTTGIPDNTYGSAGDYAVVVTEKYDPKVYYKTRKNTWVIAGSDGPDSWCTAVPTVVSNIFNPTLLDGNIKINGSPVVLTNPTNTLADLATAINSAGIDGVTASIVNGFLEIYASSDSNSTGSGSADGLLKIASGTAGSALSLGDIGLEARTYNRPTTQFSTHTSVPEWRSSDTATRRPSGSLWVKTNAVNLGANFVLSQYNLSLDLFKSISTPLYANDQSAIAGLDTSGGKLIAKGSIYTQYNADADGTLSFKFYRRNTTWPTVAIGTPVTSALTVGSSFDIQVSAPGNTQLVPSTPATILIPPVPDNTIDAVVLQINSAGIPNLLATKTAAGALSLTHTLGGVIVLNDSPLTPVLSDLGIAVSTTAQPSPFRAGVNGVLVASNWSALSNLNNLVVKSVKPSLDPEDETYWYHTVYSDVDIMIHDGTPGKTAWKGYRNVSSDARGFALNATDPNGVIVSASKPIYQSDGFTPVKLGDLWLDSSDLENYPKLHRWEPVKGVNRWVQLDNSDQNSESGIVFADVRWDTDGTSDTVNGDLVTTKTLLNSDYLDPDAPDSSAYPRGTLLFNTRRSGYSVKQYQKNYFNSVDFAFANWSSTKTYATGDRVVYTNGNIYQASSLIAYDGITPNPDPTLNSAWVQLRSSTWVNAAGNRIDGSPYMGHRAVRAVVVKALKSAIDTSTEIREEQREFTLIACPGYPELIPNMVSLNNDRKNTAFVVGDTPMRLAPVGTELISWSEGRSQGTAFDESITVADNYLAVYYPSGLFNDLTGNTIAVPPSHMALRTIVHSDATSYPWFAPAGTQRGLVDNASGLGYVNSTTGEFTTFGMSTGMRDTLYETKINPITFLPGAGIALYGQKTRSATTSAFDRINVSRLVAYIRARVDRLARPFIFEPNDKITRDQLKQSVEKFLNDLTAKRALYDFLVVCDTSINTPARIDRNELYLDIAIEPVKAIEFIYIPLRIKNTGSISGNF